MTNKSINRAQTIANRDNHFEEYSKKHIEKGKIKLKESFIKGEKVLVFREVLGDKLASHWTDGFIIEDILGPETFIVTQGTRKLRANKIHLKKDTSA